MAFFNTLFAEKEKSVLGVDIGSSSLKVVQLRKEHGEAVLETYGHYDNHARDYSFESDSAVFWVWILDHWGYRGCAEVPYGVMLPRSLEGVLMACRAISVTADAHHLLRMQNDMQRLGEVAGLAAALAVQAGCPPRAIDITALQAELVRSEALVSPGEAPRFIALRNDALGVRALPAPGAAEDLEDSLGGPQGSGAAMLLAQMATSSESARSILRRATSHALPAVRMYAAGGLAIAASILVR